MQNVSEELFVGKESFFIIRKAAIYTSLTQSFLLQAKLLSPIYK